MTRLSSAGYSYNLIVCIFIQVLQRVFRELQVVVDRGNLPVVVTPYVHNAWHHLLKLGAKLNIRIVFAVKFRLKMMAPFTYT